MTVLRDGKTIATSPVAEADLGQVIEWIAGKPHSPAKAGRPQAAAAAPRRLAGRGLAGGPIAEPVSLDVGRGDIVGLTGIIGSGYDRICEWLGGLATPEAGTVEVDGGPVPIGSVGRMRAAGIDVIAGDRSRGAFFDLKVRENLFADGIYRREQRMGLGEERSRAEALLDDFGVRPTNASELPIHALSGGNQQKVLFARAIMGDPKVLILIDPTAGVDIGARAELHRLLREAAGRGTAILLGSSDFEEIAAVSTRALVVRDGGIGAELTGDEITWDRLFAEAHGGHAIGAAGHGAEART
jgi:ribose transport system ATP-binding protein